MMENQMQLYGWRQYGVTMLELDKIHCGDNCERFAAADGTLSDNSFTKPENLYRRSSFLLNGAAA